MPETISISILSDEEIRMRCLEIVVNKSSTYDFPVYHMVEASILFRFVKEGNIPSLGKMYSRNANWSELLIEKALDLIIEERKQSNQAAYGSDTDPNDFGIPESFISRFFSGFRRKKSAL